MIIARLFTPEAIEFIAVVHAVGFILGVPGLALWRYLGKRKHSFRAVGPPPVSVPGVWATFRERAQ